jgi:hypothetical protein
MALDIYVVYPGSRAERKSPRMQLEEDGTLGYLSPFLDTVHGETGQRIEPSRAAVFTGPHLLILRAQLEAAAAALPKQPERWSFQCADQHWRGYSVTFERRARRSVVEQTLVRLNRIVDETLASGVAHLEFERSPARDSVMGRAEFVPLGVAQPES